MVGADAAPLGFDNVTFPFAGLVVAVILALVSLAVELSKARVVSKG